PDCTDQTALGWHVGMNRSGREQGCTLAYQGGVQLNGTLGDRFGGTPATQFFHAVTATESITMGRLALRFADSATYTPQSSFGFSGVGPAGEFGQPAAGGGISSTLPSVDPSLIPDQSILNGSFSRLSNSAVAAA